MTKWLSVLKKRKVLRNSHSNCTWFYLYDCSKLQFQVYKVTGIILHRSKGEKADVTIALKSTWGYNVRLLQQQRKQVVTGVSVIYTNHSWCLCFALLTGMVPFTFILKYKLKRFWRNMTPRWNVHRSAAELPIEQAANAVELKSLDRKNEPVDVKYKSLKSIT